MRYFLYFCTVNKSIYQYKVKSMKKETRIIAIANHKGGVGKTTTACNVGCILSSVGYNVLLIDLDCQANLTSSLYSGEADVTVLDVLTGDKDLEGVQLNEHLYLLPSSLSLAMADIKLSQVMARELLLREAIMKADPDVDFIILDCPPSLTLLTQNAFAAATDVIIPIKPEVLPTEGLKTICDVLDMARERLNPRIELAGVLITDWHSSTMAKEIEMNLRKKFGEKVYSQKIRHNVRLASAPLGKKGIVEYDKNSNGAKDYTALTNEILAKFGKEVR